MNLVEALSREIERVAVVRSHFEDLRNLSNVIVGPQIAMMSDAIERAHKALGAGDPIEIMDALKDLKGFEE